MYVPTGGGLLFGGEKMARPVSRPMSITRTFHRTENSEPGLGIKTMHDRSGRIRIVTSPGTQIEISTETPQSMAEVDGTTTWPELAVGLYDKLTGRGAEITYEFEDFHLQVPSRAGDNPDYAHWKMDGILKIRTKDNN